MSGFSAGANCFLNNPLAKRTIGSNPSTQRGCGIHINSHPKENKIIYCSGKNVIVRSLDDQSDCFIYRGHAHQTTVAKFSPNSYWVASADVSGKIRVWSWDNPEHILKLETPVFNGPIRDIDWDFESKKIVAVGEGSSLLAKVFVWDTGNSTGDIVGHTKPVLSVSYRPTRPFKIMTASEDMKTVLHAGPPFKLDHSNTSHSNFVNCCRYSPDGTKLVSVGSDKKIQMYDGVTGAPTNEVCDAHSGSIYSVSFSPDGLRFITSSADKTVKMWDSSSMNCLLVFNFSDDPQISDMQVAVLWSSLDKLVSVSLSGNINILDPSSPGKPSKVIEANQLAINSGVFHKGIFYSASVDGVIISTELSSGISKKLIGTDKKNISGAVHTGSVVGICVSSDAVVSVGFDDTLRFSKDGKCVEALPLVGQPTSISSSCNSDLIVVTTISEIALYKGQTKIGSLGPIAYKPTCVSLFEESEIAVGGDDMNTHIYSIEGSELKEISVIPTRSPVSSVAYDPTGSFLAVGDNGRQVEVYNRGTWDAKVKGRWVFHTSKITCLSWSPSGDRLASGSIDESIIIWNINQTNEKTQLPFAHSSGVTSLAWASDSSLVSTGSDQTIVEWNIPPLN